MQEAGGEPELLSIKEGAIQSVNHMDKADTFRVDKLVSEADATDYDGLVLPSGVANPDFLRMDEGAVRFVREFFEQGKPVGAICHGPKARTRSAIRGRTPRGKLQTATCRSRPSAPARSRAVATPPGSEAAF